MYRQASLLEQCWHSLAEARREGIVATLSVLGSALARRPVAQNGWNLGMVDTTRCTETDVRPLPVGAMATFMQDLAAIPLQVMERFFEGFLASPIRPSSAGFTRPTAPSAASVIMGQANAYLDQVPGHGALLADLVDNIALQTGYDQETIRAVIRRGLQSNGTLVWRGDSNGSAFAGIIVQMKATLRQLGYTDLREDYPLTAIPGRNDRGVLLAFDNDRATVLCYPVCSGAVTDPMVREAAMFQAGAVAVNKTSRFVWVSDGVDDFFYDFHARVAIGQLPPRTSSSSELAL